MSVSFVVVGFKFRNTTPSDLKNATTIKLIPEPSNQFDSNAIKVFADDVFVAYIARNDCAGVQEVLKIGDYKVNVVDVYNASVICSIDTILLN